MKTLWRKRDEIDALLTAPDAAAGELMKRRGAVERDLAAAEARWLEASEAVEAVKQGEADA
jgi:hypothetical protein